MKKLFFLPLFGLLFLAVSCPNNNPPTPTPPPDVLPPATQTGANTFGCLINGKVWLPGGGGQPSIVPSYFKNTFSIGVQKSVYNLTNQPIVMQLFDFSVKPVYDTGKYYIKNKNLTGGVGFEDQISKCTYTYNDKDSLQNWVHITKLDKTNLIISGTFNFLFTNTTCDTIKMTSGRFDAKYTY